MSGRHGDTVDSRRDVMASGTESSKVAMELPRWKIERDKGGRMRRQQATMAGARSESERSARLTTRLGFSNDGMPLTLHSCWRL